MSIRLAAWLIGFFSSSAAMAASITVGSVIDAKVRENGCPGGSVSAELSPDGKELALRFRDFRVEAGKNAKSDQSFSACKVSVPLHADRLVRVAIQGVEMRALANVPQDAWGSFRAHYSGAYPESRPWSALRSHLRYATELTHSAFSKRPSNVHDKSTGAFDAGISGFGANVQEYMHLVEIRSPCGQDFYFDLESVLEVRPPRRSGRAAISLIQPAKEGADVGFKFRLKIVDCVID